MCLSVRFQLCTLHMLCVIDTPNGKKDENLWSMNVVLGALVPSNHIHCGYIQCYSCSINCLTMNEWDRRVSKQETIWCNNNIVCIKCWWLAGGCACFSFRCSFRRIFFGLVASASVSCLLQIKHIFFVPLFLFCDRSTTTTTLIVFKCTKSNLNHNFFSIIKMCLFFLPIQSEVMSSICKTMEKVDRPRAREMCAAL